MEVDTARVTGITVRAVGVDLAGLSGGALFELRRCFGRNARKCRQAILSKAKKRLRDGLGQLEEQLTAEAKRRGLPEPRPGAASLTVIFDGVEDAAYLAAFLEGLEQVYLSERSKIMRQGQVERNILDVRCVAFECSTFVGKIARAIGETRVEV